MVSQTQSKAPATRPPLAYRAPQRAGSGEERDPRRRAVSALGPAGLSVACHGILMFLLTLMTWVVGGGGDGVQAEFTAKVVTQSESTNNFQFSGENEVDRPDADNSRESIRDLASLLEQNETLQMTPVDVGSSGLQTIAVGQLSRSDIVGTTVTGAGGGDAGGLGGRNLAGGGTAGSMWGVGVGQEARSVVYVMDRSGSMADTFWLLQQELRSAIGQLTSDQLFNVIWFNEGKADVWSERMRKATDKNKRDVFEKIDLIVPTGQTQPINAVKKGLDFKPDVMFVLSDGDFGDDNEPTINLFKTRNRRKRTIVNTILFIYGAGQGERVLRTIADMNNGTFKHVTAEEAKNRRGRRRR